DGTTLIGTVTADATTGAWSLTPAVALTDGSHAVKATSTDAAGNTSVDSNINTFTVDTAAPAAPVVTGPANGSIINNNKPVVSGTAEPNSLVTVYIDGLAIGTTTAGANGTWTFTPTTPLIDGAHIITATSKDAAGNISSPSPAVRVTVVTALPSAPVVTGPANNSITSNNKPVITGTAVPNSIVTVYVDGVAIGTTTANASGNWTFIPASALADGQHLITATSTDAAGNVSAPSASSRVTIDTTAPLAPTGPALADGKSSSLDKRPPMVGTAEPGSIIKLYDENNRLIGTGVTGNDGKWLIIPNEDLAFGLRNITATATDAANNVSASGKVLSVMIISEGDFSANNVLTPNGDGKNDYLIIKNLELYPNNSIRIFDRAGRLLFNVRGYNNDWDGSINGSPLAEDTYYYIIDYGNGVKPFKGFITIIRRK
ncbi:MAG: T9SS type B sorting domain-containing protein, partial [Pedobacter sp.]